MVQSTACVGDRQTGAQRLLKAGLADSPFTFLLQFIEGRGFVHTPVLSFLLSSVKSMCRGSQSLSLLISWPNDQLGGAQLQREGCKVNSGRLNL